MLDTILDEIKIKSQALEEHPLYSQIDSIENLKFFMERHCFAVFDFMSLTKALQNEFSPVCKIWTPPKDRELSRFINEIVLAEESDTAPDGRPMSHFEMYCLSMDEIKASSDKVLKFTEIINDEGFETASQLLGVPSSARHFMTNTFSLIQNGKIHQVAASFCFGREKIIPPMFISLLKKMNIGENEAPLFHYYLNRHIEIDSGTHGPLALKMLEVLCGRDENKWEDAKSAALDSLDARITFWDQVLDELTYTPKVSICAALTSEAQSSMAQS